jgi:F0F1-type ATP synthase assembly protein I
MSPENKKYFSKMLDFSALGLEMGACVIIGTYLGMFVDKKFDTEPWGISIGIFFGLGAMVSSLFKAVKRVKKYEEEEGDE